MSKPKTKSKPEISSPLDDIGASVLPQPRTSRAGRAMAEKIATKTKTPIRQLPAAVPPAGRSAGPSWDDTHKAETFYCPLDVRDRLIEAMKSSKRSKSRVIVDALCEHLGIAAPSRSG
jgi:hypothetical protein